MPETAILVVDDQPTILKVLHKFIKEHGFYVYIAESGERAISILDHINPELILLDICMPGMDGFETCRKIKQIPKTADIPVIFITGLKDVDYKVAGFEAGGV